MNKFFGVKTSGKLNLENIREEAEERRRKEIEELKASSKELYQLIFSEKFTVQKVLGNAYATSFTPHSEMMIGGQSPVYEGGFCLETILDVIPDNKGIPVRTLHFKGYTPVRAGERILAFIPKYELLF